MLWFYVVLILVAWIYLNSGFRFRLVLLIINLTTIYYITKSIRPNLLVWSILGVAFILFMGIMEYSRTYEKGLIYNVSKAKERKSYLKVVLMRLASLWQVGL